VAHATATDYSKSTPQATPMSYIISTPRQSSDGWYMLIKHNGILPREMPHPQQHLLAGCSTHKILQHTVLQPQQYHFLKCSSQWLDALSVSTHSTPCYSTAPPSSEMLHAQHKVLHPQLHLLPDMLHPRDATARSPTTTAPPAPEMLHPQHTALYPRHHLLLRCFTHSTTLS